MDAGVGGVYADAVDGEVWVWGGIDGSYGGIPLSRIT